MHGEREATAGGAGAGRRGVGTDGRKTGRECGARRGRRERPRLSVWRRIAVVGVRRVVWTGVCGRERWTGGCGGEERGEVGAGTGRRERAFGEVRARVCGGCGVELRERGAWGREKVCRRERFGRVWMETVLECTLAMRFW